MKETMESVFMALPNGCVLKNPNSYNPNRYTCTYKENSKYSLRTTGDTPTEAVVRMAELLAFNRACEDSDLEDMYELSRPE